MIRLIKQEPVLFQAIIQATLALIGAFGVKLGAGQVGSILALTAAHSVVLDQDLCDAHCRSESRRWRGTCSQACDGLRSKNSLTSP